jgi:DNA-binding response OmpR family regulator
MGDPVNSSPDDSKELGERHFVGDVRILILDDDPTICQLMHAALVDHHFPGDASAADPRHRGRRDALAETKFQVDTVSDPASMEMQLRADPPYHVIILDYVIPGIESDQLLGWVREYQPEASMIVVTAYPSIDSALSCLRARTYDYLTKPFQVAQLQRVVARCLESKGLLRMSEEALREALGNVIRERRKTLGLTLAQLAQRTNVSLGYLSQIELGKNSASIETLYRISLGLGIKLSELFEAVQGSL